MEHRFLLLLCPSVPKGHPGGLPCLPNLLLLLVLLALFFILRESCYVAPTGLKLTEMCLLLGYIYIPELESWLRQFAVILVDPGSLPNIHMVAYNYL